MDILKPQYLLITSILVALICFIEDGVIIVTLTSVGIYTILKAILKHVFMNYRIIFRHFDFRYKKPLYSSTYYDNFIVFDKRVLEDTFLLQEITVLLNLYSKYYSVNHQVYMVHSSDESIFLELLANSEALQLRELNK